MNFLRTNFLNRHTLYDVMVKGKHVFHCAKDNEPCTIYKKGKGHRVLVCPQCGVIATNPFSFSRLLKGGAGGAAMGAAGGPVGAAIGAGVGAVSSLFGGGESESTPTTPRHSYRSPPRVSFSTGERLALALR